jgi:hypothetical protein
MGLSRLLIDSGLPRQTIPEIVPCEQAVPLSDSYTTTLVVVWRKLLARHTGREQSTWGRLAPAHQGCTLESRSERNIGLREAAPALSALS